MRRQRIFDNVNWNRKMRSIRKGSRSCKSRKGKKVEDGRGIGGGGGKEGPPSRLFIPLLAPLAAAAEEEVQEEEEDEF